MFFYPPAFIKIETIEMLKINWEIFVAMFNVYARFLIETQGFMESWEFLNLSPRNGLKTHIYFHMVKFIMEQSFSLFLIMMSVLAELFTYNVESIYLQLR